MRKKTSTDELIQGIYETALDEEPWEEVFRSIVQNFTGHAGQLFTTFLHDRSQGGVALDSGFAVDVRESYLPEVAEVDLWYHELVRRHGVDGRIPTGLVFSSRNLVSPAQLVRSRFYADYVRPLGVGDSIGAVIGDGTQEDLPTAAICLYRPPSAKPFEASDMHRLATLRPHFSRALAMRVRVHRAATNAVSLAFESLQTAVMVLGADARVLMANPAAEQLLAQRPHLKIRFGRLRAQAESQTVRLEHLLRICARRDLGSQASLSVRLAGEPGSGVVAHLVPPPARWPLGPNAVAIAFLKVEGQAAAGMGPVLASLYGLSPAEVSLVMGLCEGQTPDEFSGARGVTMNTVRTQLKAVFYKTNVRRQSDLMRLVYSITR